MKHELFSNMRKQMTPGPEVRAALRETLARPVKRRPVPWKKYGAVAACAVLAVGVLGASQYPSWKHILQNFRPGILETKLHSYVTVEGLTEIMPENVSATETGGGDTGAPKTGDLPGGAYVGDAPSQEEAVNTYQKLMDHFNGTPPDWYGGAYIDGSGWLVVQLVEDKDPVDKSLELQVLDWTGSDRVIFSSCKYSLAHLNELMDELNALPGKDMKFRDVMAGWGIDGENNRIELTLTQVYEPILAVLAELDPDDDAIYVQVGQRASADDTVKEGEDPAVYHVMPGGVPAPSDEDLIAVEPYYDGSPYGVDELPEELPEQKRPALEVPSVSWEDTSTLP